MSIRTLKNDRENTQKQRVFSSFRIISLIICLLFIARAAIRNLRYKKHLVVKVQDETKALFQQRDGLVNVGKSLQGQKTSLAFEVEYLRKEKEELERAITTDKYLLEQTLAQALMNLKIQRPDLFTLSGPEQVAMLLRVILK